MPYLIVQASVVDLFEAHTMHHSILLFPVVPAPHLRTIFKVFKDIAVWGVAWGIYALSTRYHGPSGREGLKQGAVVSQRAKVKCGEYPGLAPGFPLSLSRRPHPLDSRPSVHLSYPVTPPLT